MPAGEFQRVLSEAQVREVARLAHEIWNEHYVAIIGQTQVNYMLAKFQSREVIARQIDGECEYYLIMHDGQAVGYIGLVAEPAREGLLLSKLYVLRDCRGLGLGKAALAFVEGLCLGRRIDRLWLTVNRHNEDSLHWYERMGFANVGPIVQDIGGGFVMDDFKMVKPIHPPAERP